MGTIIVGAALAAIVALIVRSMMRDKKRGKSLHCGEDCKHCGEDCKHCGGHCH